MSAFDDHMADFDSGAYDALYDERGGEVGHDRPCRDRYLKPVESLHTITARFSSRCTCGARVTAGDRMIWDALRKMTRGCSECDMTGKRKPVPSEGAGLGCDYGGDHPW